MQWYFFSSLWSSVSDYNADLHCCIDINSYSVNHALVDSFAELAVSHFCFRAGHAKLQYNLFQIIFPI